MGADSDDFTHGGKSSFNPAAPEPYEKEPQVCKRCGNVPDKCECKCPNCGKLECECNLNTGSANPDDDFSYGGRSFAP